VLLQELNPCQGLGKGPLSPEDIVAQRFGAVQGYLDGITTAGAGKEGRPIVIQEGAIGQDRKTHAVGNDAIDDGLQVGP
jgi:hypothetical protein